MRRFRFYKQSDGRWYVDLPEWTGSKDDLEMVMGADDMLLYMAEGNNEVALNISEDYFENSDELKIQDTGVAIGAYYRIEKYRGVEIGLDVWLCPVMEFVFGGYPEKLFIATVN